ncbi:hypothetical protein [uncultured Pseudoalteromonas sp.]|uniref:hypothetical protein n=1 Tax=uncultured Pseudoalteromonas sp. TaxID=114053 RepID=UPI0025938319|nr:hypothetical protein [uncultured Pseudoalteromonas sp.]
MKSKLLLASALLLPAFTFANEKPQLSQEDMENVVSGIITLKTNCVTNKLANCESADAVMKMFRTTVQTTNGAGLKNHYLEKYRALFMETLIDASIEAKAASK